MSTLLYYGLGAAALLLLGKKKKGSGTVSETASETVKNTVRVGNIVREGGSAAWRARNPGNIVYSDWAAKNGAVGKLPWGTRQNPYNFAVWPSDEAGMQAIVKLLQTEPYQKLTIGGAMARWAPGADPNNKPTLYAQLVSGPMGVPASYSMRNLTAAQLRQMAEAIKKVEGWIPGKEYTV